MANVYGEKSNLKIQWEKVKEAPLKERLLWLVQYFWLYAVVVIAVLAFGTAFLVTYIRGKQPEVISGIFYNTEFETSDEEEIHKILAEELGIERKGTRITLTPQVAGAADTEYAIYQSEAVAVRIAAKGLDLIGSTGTILNGYINLNDESDSLMARVSDYLGEDLMAAFTKAGRTRTLETKYGTHVFFVNIANSRLADLLKIKSEEYWVGIPCTAPHKEAIIAFLKLALEPSPEP